MKPSVNEFFTTNLLLWHKSISRPLPWKGIKNPYLIWLSEIILQQTRVEQGLPYYQKFKEAYPSVKDMAKAPEDEIMKLWEGLGYYSRARNMHFTAKHITENLGGNFPDTYEGILALKGVGTYTAAAIASFAFKLPFAVVDGNVFRVLSRVFGIDTPIDSTQGKKSFSSLAQELLDKDTPGAYNQAIMDFGATQCVPKNPNCTKCPFLEKCVAYRDKKIGLLPLKAKKIKKRDRFFYYLLINQSERILLDKRNDKDIWQGLYQFPLIETNQPIGKEKDLLDSEKWKEIFKELTISVESISTPFKQTLTHQKIVAQFLEITLEQKDIEKGSSYFWVDRKSIHEFAFPKIIDLYLRDKTLYLKLL